MERMKVVVEPAGAATVAALLAGKAGDLSGLRVGTVLTGGNVDLGVVVPQPPPPTCPADTEGRPWPGSAPATDRCGWPSSAPARPACTPPRPCSTSPTWS